MKINSILNRYVFKEMIPPFIINLVFFTFIFLMAKILDITKLIVNYRISISSVRYTHRSKKRKNTTRTTFQAIKVKKKYGFLNEAV